MKSIFNPRTLFIGLAWLAGVHLTSAQPSLGIGTAGNQSLVFWPTTPTNYILQSSTNLASSNWVTAADAVMVTAAVVNQTSPAKFFRLIYNTPPAGMALIPAGSFTIGNSSGDSDMTDAIATNVYLSAFYMEANLVSYALWQSIYTNATALGYSFTNSGTGKATNHPVQTVNWFDCVKWCNARSQQESLAPIYFTDAGFTQVFTNGDAGTTVYPKWVANGYRLPTEAEWEKAARGGLIGRRFPWGNRISEGQANYVGNTNLYSYDLGSNGTNAIGLADGYPHTTAIGTFDMNGYGLYDMAGNVFQWCWDLVGNPPYPAGSPYLGGTDPRGPETGNNRRIERGSSWDFGGAGAARCARRNQFISSSAANTVGFRCVRSL